MTHRRPDSIDSLLSRRVRQAPATQRGQLAGEWRNWDCAGSTATVRGSISVGTITLACTNQAECPLGNVWLFNFDLASSQFDAFVYDRVNPPIQQVINEPFRIGQGTCPSGEGSIPLTLRR